MRWEGQLSPDERDEEFAGTQSTPATLQVPLQVPARSERAPTPRC
jgi:hypothetical protein